MWKLLHQLGSVNRLSSPPSTCLSEEFEDMVVGDNRLETVHSEEIRDSFEQSQLEWNTSLVDVVVQQTNYVSTLESLHDIPSHFVILLSPPIDLQSVEPQARKRHECGFFGGIIVLWESSKFILESMETAPQVAVVGACCAGSIGLDVLVCLEVTIPEA
ncbi:hypothetical protein V6N11_074323 [Hibiscus sabdariffa]|uniref:Uncharacterized protein n=1 Tax=Hibiscus sabdariffa TaxID=183260 RepID=A0ABR2R369_9ROSI